MAFQSGDLMVVNRAGTDYKAEIDELLAVAEGQINDGKLVIKESQGTNGNPALQYEFTANQASDSQVTIGNGNLQLVADDGTLVGDFFANQSANAVWRLPAPPLVGSGDIVIAAGGGLTTSGDATHNANQQDDSLQTLSVKTGGGLEINGSGEIVIKSGSGISIDLNGNVIIDPTFDLSNQVELALNDLTDVDDTDANEGEVLVKLTDGTYGFKDIAELPAAVHPKGFIEVKNPAPADPVPGDLYIQHDPSGTDINGQVADASFVGIAGTTVEEGTFVIFGADDEWHAGGTIQNVEGVQSDWNETDSDSLAFIKNKPCVYECNTYIPSLPELP